MASVVIRAVGDGKVTVGLGYKEGKYSGSWW